MSSLPPLPPPPESGAPPPPPGSLPPQHPEVTTEEPVERRATVPVVVALLLTVSIGVGAFALVTWVGGGASCEGTDFESDRFGYCVRTPAGWVAVPSADADPPLDRFMVQDGPGTITVVAVELSQGQDLARFEQFVRGYVEDAGATTGPSSTFEVDGVEAVGFDVTLEGPDGVVRSREVLFAREGVAWRVTLADEDLGFEASERQLEELLASWRFT